MKKSREELIEIHKALHGALDRLAACYLESSKDGKMLTNTSVMEFIEWSYKQTQEPGCLQSYE